MISTGGPTFWIAEVSFTAQGVTPQTIEDLDAEGDPCDWYVTPTASGVRVAAYDTPHDPARWAHEVAERARTWLRGHGLTVDDFTELRVLTEQQHDTEASTPTMPELVSATDAGKLLGVSRQRVNRLHDTHRLFPAPIAHLATGAVWDGAAIRAFARDRNRASGRPAQPA